MRTKEVTKYRHITTNIYQLREFEAPEKRSRYIFATVSVQWKKKTRDNDKLKIKPLLKDNKMIFFEDKKTDPIFFIFCPPH